MSTPNTVNRRTAVKNMLGLALAPSLERRLLGESRDLVIGRALPPRREGELDIHHIDTGRGNCTLIVGPDGTTIMIDAGASNSPFETSGHARPNGSRRPGEWQALYALKATGRRQLDYLVVTHIHPDHVGDVSDINPVSAAGTFRLTGVSDVDALMPIGKVIDRAYPDYGAFPPPASPFATNYLAFLKSRQENGRSVERAVVGSTRQLGLRDRALYPDFNARVLASNGAVWTGSKEETHVLLPDPRTLKPEDLPGENLLSTALRVSYGNFSYFSGGDLTSDTHDGQSPWMDVESPVTKIAGRTEVAAADHHGYFDACGPNFARNLDAQAYVIQAWDVGHPGSEQLQRMLGAWSNKALHDVYATDMLPANELINRRFTPLVKSQQGHVCVRVSKGGGSYVLAVLDSRTTDAPVKAMFGPYQSRQA